MHAAHTAIASRLRSTALMLVTTAVTVSTRRSTIIGSENAAAENTISAKIDPTALPMPKNVSVVAPAGLPRRSGKNTWIAEPARAQTRNTTISISANTIRLPNARCSSRMQRRSDGILPRSSWRLIA